jgi:hypothetical protein
MARLRNRPTDLIEGRYAVGFSAAIFIGFVAAGCTYIIAGKLGGIGQIYVTFVPIAIMLAYALLITLARSLRLRDDQSGDNLYYMGFLFTLTSLGVSLYQFSAARAAEEIVQNFGIAIGSTIAGIGLRVIFNQMRRDPVEVERTMRLELAEAARRVRRELDSSVVEFGYFRRTAQQSATDSLNHMTAALDELLARFFAKLDEAAGKATLPVEDASRKSGAAIDALSEAVGTTLAAGAGQFAAEAERLSAKVAVVATALDELTAKINAMPTPERMIETRLQSIAHALTTPIESLAAQSERQMKAINDVLATAGAAIESAANLIGAARGEFDATAAANRTTVEAAVAMIRSTADVLNEIKASSRDYVDALAMMLERTDEMMRTLTDTLVQSSSESIAWTDRLSQALPAIEEKAEALALAAERIAATVANYPDRQMHSEAETIS